MNKNQLKLYAVTDRACLKDVSLEDAVEAALSGGVTMLQLREKDAPTDEYVKTAIKIKKICEKYRVPLIIDDNVETAKLSGADGVHLGQNDMPVSEARGILGADAIIGITAKTPEQAIAAENGGADYLGSGAVFGTVTKSDAKKMSLETLRKITGAVNIPIAAIGGINADNIKELKNTGIAGAAVVSAIFGADDIRAAAEKLRALAEEL